MHHLFIINPAAGRNNTHKIIDYINEYFNKDSSEYTIVLTRYRGHAAEIVKENLKGRYCCIYAAGGDGTVNEVLNGIMDSDISCLHGLGIIPLGSGNDFVKSLDSGYTKMRIKDIKNLIKNTIEGKLKQTDLIKADERYFLNVASSGFDAEVVYNSLILKKLQFISPRLSYFISVLYSLINMEFYYNQIQIDDDAAIRKKILFIAAGNGKYYGGGMKVLPGAAINDGLMDICIVETISRRKLITLFPSFIRGTHIKLSEVTMMRAKKLILSVQQEQKMQIDGELVSHKKDIEIIVSPFKINLLIPCNLRD